MVFTLTDHRKDFKMFKAQVEPSEANDNLHFNVFDILGTEIICVVYNVQYMYNVF